MNKSVTLKAITSEQLCRIYAGALSNWKDLNGGAESIVPLTRPDRDATKETVRNSFACFKDLKETPSVVIVPTSPEMTKILANRPATFGFTDAVAVDDVGGAIIGLTLEGVAPTADNVRTGKYKIIKNNFLLTKGEPKGAVKAFIDFVKGPRGRKDHRGEQGRCDQIGWLGTAYRMHAACTRNRGDVEMRRERWITYERSSDVMKSEKARVQI